MRNRSHHIDHEAEVGIASPAREGGMQDRTVILICAMVFAVTLAVATTALLVAPNEILGTFYDADGNATLFGHKIAGVGALALAVFGIHEAWKIKNVFFRMLAIAAEIGLLAHALFLYAAHVG